MESHAQKPVLTGDHLNCTAISYLPLDSGRERMTSQAWVPAPRPPRIGQAALLADGQLVLQQERHAAERLVAREDLVARAGAGPAEHGEDGLALQGLAVVAAAVDGGGGRLQRHRWTRSVKAIHGMSF